MTAAAPSATPPPRTSSLFLPIPLFLLLGRVVVSALLANVLRCCRRVWREERRHVRHVHGGMRPPRRSIGDRRKADIMRSLYTLMVPSNQMKREPLYATGKGKGRNGDVVAVAPPAFFKSPEPLSLIGRVPGAGRPRLCDVVRLEHPSKWFLKLHTTIFLFVLLCRRLRTRYSHRTHP